jgi:uncharacterized protein (DUF362 family)
MLAEVEFTSYEESIRSVLESIDAGSVLAGQKRILIKPNLVQATPFPVTTSPECVAALIAIVRQCSRAEIIIAEGCGAANYDTERVFNKLGYCALADRLGVKLVNLNREELVRLEGRDCEVFPEFYLPAIALDSFILSVPVLKAHTLAEVTGTLKNMMGFAPPEHYQQGGHWKKSAFHARIHESIRDLNQYRTPDLTVLDATVGLAEAHLGGPVCDPPVNRIIAGNDPLETDRRAAELLGLDWRTIPHLYAF